MRVSLWRVSWCRVVPRHKDCLWGDMSLAPPETSLSTNSWSAAVNSSAAGEMEATGAWPEAATGGGSTLFTFEPLSVLLGKTRVRPDRGGVSKVKVSELVNQWHLCKDRLIVRCLTGRAGKSLVWPSFTLEEKLPLLGWGHPEWHAEPC